MSLKSKIKKNVETNHENTPQDYRDLEKRIHTFLFHLVKSENEKNISNNINNQSNYEITAKTEHYETKEQIMIAVTENNYSK